MSYTQDKAVGRKAGDPLDTILSPTSPQQGSNQVRFTQSQAKTVATPDSGNQEKSTANSKGTGRENVTSAIALAGKRRTNLKLPANY